MRMGNVRCARNRGRYLSTRTEEPSMAAQALPGVQGNLGMDLRTRHGPPKSSKVREGVEGHFSWVVPHPIPCSGTFFV